MNKKKMYLFACIEKNIGDDLFVYTICQRYPNVEFIISDDAIYLKVNSINNLTYSKILRKWNFYSSKESKNFFKKAVINFFKNLYKLRLEKLDSVYIVGNAFKNMNYRGKEQLNWLENRIDLANDFYLLSTNYGPANDNRWAKDCENVFVKMTDICFRDLNSYELFNNLDNVRYGADVVLSLKIDKNSKVKKNLIIISVIDCKMAERGEKLNKSAEIYESKIIELVNNLTINGYEVILLNSNTSQDEPASQRIYSKCVDLEKVEIFDYTGNVQEVFDIYSMASGVIGTRLHTIILSWLFNVPVLPIIYDIKVKNLLNSYNFNEKNMNIDDLNELSFSLIEKMLDTYSYKLSDWLLDNSNNQFKILDEKLR